jgi:hypothetical protein
VSTCAGLSGGLEKAPASEGGRYKGKRTARGRGEPLPYNDLRGHLKVAATGALEAGGVLGYYVEGAFEG